MHFILSLVASFSATALVMATDGVQCGTTRDATLSDCQQLVQPATWNVVWAGTGNVCTYDDGSVQRAYNTACHGNCCVYFASKGDFITPDQETTRLQAAGLMGCGSISANKINGMERFEGTHGVCISDGKGCGDCFGDADFLSD